MNARKLQVAIIAIIFTSVAANSLAADKGTGVIGQQGDSSKLNKSIEGKLKLGNPYFLSSTNPTATTDQRDLDALAILVLQMPVVQKAKEQAAKRWKTIVGHDGTPEAWARFDELIDEWAFNYVLKAVNS